jgi:hypothetical protein
MKSMAAKQITVGPIARKRRSAFASLASRAVKI